MSRIIRKPHEPPRTWHTRIPAAAVFCLLVAAGLLAGTIPQAGHLDAAQAESRAGDGIIYGALNTDAVCQQVGPWCLVAACESGLNPAAVNPADPVTGSYGIVQIKQRTWDGTAEWMGWTHLIGLRPDWQPIAVQIQIADALAFSVSWGGLSHWTCGYLYGADGCHNGFCRTYATPPPPPPTPTPAPRERTQAPPPPDPPPLSYWPDGWWLDPPADLRAWIIY